jgi:DNA-binding transcriptional regulator YhcF (GntR family)
MNKKGIENKLEKCLKECAAGRTHLRKCVADAMERGLTKQDILAIADEMATGGLKDEASLCAVTAIGQALRYEKKLKKVKPIELSDRKKEEIKNKIKGCFKKCGLTRRQLRKCVVNALKAGLTKEEVLAVTDDIVGGFGKNQVSVCAIVAVDEVLKYEEIDKLKKMVKMYAPYMEFPE